jgi:polyisoprenoid-binding protein YceI
MATTNWALDPTHSEVNFKVKHLMITNVTGGFTDYSITASTDSDDFSNANISFTAKAASVNTGNEQRDAHLKGADFFDAENFPELSFKATSYKATDDAGNYELNGDLTIKNVTKPIKLSVEFGGIAKDPWGNAKAGFTISGKINRKDWGLNWNAALEAGGVLVSDEVKINCEIQLLKQ